MRTTIFLIAVSVICFSSSVQAHPVSFKGGYGIMPGYTPERKELELNYSLTNSQAIGVNTINLEYEGRELNFFLPQYSHKLFIF